MSRVKERIELLMNRNARRNHPSWKTTLLALALVLGATAAHAADTCYRGVNGTTLVFKKFRLPRPGDCSPIEGFQNDSDCTLSGTACGTSDGSQLVHFNFNSICHFNGFGTYSFFTDRSIYRPQQTVYWNVLVYSRPARGEPRLLPGTEVEVALKDPNGQAVTSGRFKTNELGTAAGSFVLPLGRPLGRWVLQSSSGGSVSLRVEEYKRPTFEVTLDEGDRIPNRDFVLRWKVAGEGVRSGLVVQKDKDGKGGYFAMMVVPPEDPTKGAVYDVRSGAPGKAKDGTAYSGW